MPYQIRHITTIEALLAALGIRYSLFTLTSVVEIEVIRSVYRAHQTITFLSIILVSYFNIAFLGSMGFWLEFTLLRDHALHYVNARLDPPLFRITNHVRVID